MWRGEGCSSHLGNCGRRAQARSPGSTCSGKSLGGSHTSHGSRGCPRRIRSRLRRKKTSLGLRPLCTITPRVRVPLSRRLSPPLAPPPPHSEPTWPPLAGPTWVPPICLRSPSLYPIRDPEPALTATGPAPLAAVARLTGDALEAPGFVLAFAIRTGARISALIDVCAERRKTRLGTMWLARRSGSSAGPPPVTHKQGELALLGSRTPTSEALSWAETVQVPHLHPRQRHS